MRGQPTAFQLETLPSALPALAAPLMPIELLECPESVGFGPLHNGALMALCKAYWRAGCRLNVTTDAELMVISGCYMRRWQTIRAPVLRAFEALKPRLSTVYAELARKAANRLEVSNKGRLAAQALRDARMVGKSQLSDQPSDVALLTPRKSKTSVSNVARGLGATLTDAAE